MYFTQVNCETCANHIVHGGAVQAHLVEPLRHGIPPLSLYLQAKTVDPRVRGSTYQLEVYRVDKED